MKDRVKKPIIISLLENKNYRTEDEGAVTNLLQLTKNVFGRQILEQQCSRRTNNLHMVSALDEEMRNNFKWLINFNVRKILKHSLDDRPVGRGNKSAKRQEVISPRKNIVGNDQEYNLTGKEFIKQCLTEMEGVTVKEIQNWISEKHPNFKPNGYGWKNFVRKTLLQDPCFQKKKSKKNGRYLWYLNKIYSGDSDCYEENLLQNTSFTVTEAHLNEQRTLCPLTKFKRDTSMEIRSTKECSNFENDSFYTSIVNAMPAETTWMGSADNVLELESRYFIEDRRDEEESIEFYEMKPPLQQDILDENCEVIEVHLVGENHELLPMKLLNNS